MSSPWSCDMGGTFNDVPTLLCLAEILVRIVNVLILFSGLAFVILFLWGCLKFIISQGDPKAVGAAKNSITYAIIGLIIIIMSFAFVKFAGNFLGVTSMANLQFSLGD